VVKRGTPLPTKLKHDAILEAILELRIASQPIPEVFYGRLVDHRYWKSFSRHRLPTHEIPEKFRLIDPNVRYIPVIELIAPDSKAALRVGPYAVSYHRTAPYVGWKNFSPDLLQVVDSLFETTTDPTIERLGLRYLNAMSVERHHIKSIGDLDIKLTDADGEIATNVNINFTRELTRDSSCTVRIATKEFIQGDVPADTTVIIDVDVFTNDGFKTTDKEVVKQWVTDAHNYEKNEFFHLFTQTTIDQLREE
jgi:uncharacterized protein (TIGR04255 family)